MFFVHNFFLYWVSYNVGIYSNAGISLHCHAYFQIHFLKSVLLEVIFVVHTSHSKVGDRSRG